MNNTAEDSQRSRWQRITDAVAEGLGYVIGAIIIAAMVLVPLWLVIWLQGAAGDAKAARAAETIAGFTIGFIALLWAIVIGVGRLLPDWVWWWIALLILFRWLSEHFRSIVREELDRRKEP